MHAEQDCIAKCKNKSLIKDSYMILVKITNSEEVAPCQMCQHIIDKYKTRRVISFIFEKT
jgi:cytidine deaminase